MEIKVRLGNLELRKAVYINDRVPEHHSYHIDKWVPNEHYKKKESILRMGIIIDLKALLIIEYIKTALRIQKLVIL